MENEAAAQEVIAQAQKVREINTKPCDPEELEADFKTFLGRFNGEGANLRCELVTGAEGMRFIAVFNWDDMG